MKRRQTELQRESDLVEEVQLGDVGDLCVEQLVGDVEDSLLNRQLQKTERHFRLGRLDYI